MHVRNDSLATARAPSSRHTRLGFLFAAGLATLGHAGVANAAITVWDLEGTITTVGENPGFDPFPDEFVVGMPFRVRIAFDTTEQPVPAPQIQGSGSRYNYNNLASLRFNVYLGESCSPCVPQGSHNIIVRDNATFNGVPVDGYSFGVNTTDGQAIGLILRGPVLDIVGGGALPEMPDSRLADLTESNFQICNGNEGCLFGDVTSITRRTFRTTWEIQGTIDEVGNSEEFESMFDAGDRFRILVDLDTQTVLDYDPQNAGAGKRYDYSARSMSFKIYIGEDGPFDIAFQNDGGGGLIVRDNAPVGGVAMDGYSPYLRTLDPIDEDDPSQGKFFSDIGLLMRGPVLDIVNGAVIAAAPDTRLGGPAMTTRVLQVCRWLENSNPDDVGCDFGYINGTIDSVAEPAFGASYFLSARDCMQQTAPWDSFPDDCVSSGFPNGLSTSAGGLGRGEFVGQFAPESPWTGSSLGSTFGSISFSGPITLPVVKGQSLPSATSRNNANLQAYQLYRYQPENPQSLPIPLVVELTYKIADYSDPSYPTLGNQIGLRPGGAELTTVLAVVDGDRVPMASVALANFNGLLCGSEANFQLPDGSPWPAGSILGTSVFRSPAGQQTQTPNGVESVTIPVSSCANPGSAPQLSPGQRFVVVTSMQSPARGAKSRLSADNDAEGDGFVDSANTLRVKLDPAAPPALVQTLADSIEPECVNCGFVADVLGITMDLKPESADNCLNPGASGVIPVALLGASGFDVRKVRLDESLRLGTQGLRIRGSKPLCSVSSLNGDSFEDLVCHFENAPSNWAAGQTSVTVTGLLLDGTPVEGTDRVCLVR